MLLRDLDLRQMMAIGIALAVDLPHAPALHVAIGQVIRLLQTRKLEAFGAQLLRPLRMLRHVTLVDPSDHGGNQNGDAEHGLDDRQEADAARSHRDDFRMTAEAPHRVERRQHQGRRGEPHEVRGKIATEEGQDRGERQLRLQQTRERGRKLKQNENGDKARHTVE